MVKLSLVAIASLACHGAAFQPNFGPHGLQPRTPFDDQVDEIIRRENVAARQAGSTGYGTFDQLIDHQNAALGTFSNRFWYTTQFWHGPGSPVVFINPGESPADGFNNSHFSTQRLTGRIAEAIGAAMVVLEHRYYGGSSPFEELTVNNLQYLALDQVMDDARYFARTWEPPFDTSNSSHPANAPWVIIGGSYSGSLAAWFANSDDNPFWAHYASSGVVEAIEDYWMYWDTTLKATATNCSRDVEGVVDYIDHILLHGSRRQKTAIKSRFGMQKLANADFMRALANAPLTWQWTQFAGGPNNVWPGSGNPVPGRRGVGTIKALNGYVKWINEVMRAECEKTLISSELQSDTDSAVYPCSVEKYDDYKTPNSTACFALSNATDPRYSDYSVVNFNYQRQWNWLLCSESFGWSFVSPPWGRPSIVSRLLTRDYYLNQCALWFPESEGGYGFQHGRTPATVNARTGGWDVPFSQTPRLLYVNGELDPWRGAGVSSLQRPGGPRRSSDKVVVKIVPKGGHVSEINGANWAVNAEVAAIATEAVSLLQGWTDDYYTERNITKP